jgi:hypothetical protein
MGTAAGLGIQGIQYHSTMAEDFLKRGGKLVSLDPWHCFG